MAEERAGCPKLAVSGDRVLHVSVWGEASEFPRKDSGAELCCCVWYALNVRPFVTLCSLALLLDTVPSSLFRSFTHASYFSIGEYWTPIGLEIIDRVLFSARKSEFETAVKSACWTIRLADSFLSSKGRQSTLLVLISSFPCEDITWNESLLAWFHFVAFGWIIFLLFIADLHCSFLPWNCPDSGKWANLLNPFDETISDLSLLFLSFVVCTSFVVTTLGTCFDWAETSSSLWHFFPRSKKCSDKVPSLEVLLKISL